MNLLFDAGNTRLKWASVDQSDQILDSGSIGYERSDWDALFSNGIDSVSRVLISSVAGASVNSELESRCLTAFDVRPSFAQVSSSATDIVNEYRDITRLGVDRWVAALGVADRRGINRILIDAGTAITIDLVDADNVFLGGVILPGADLMHRSLTGQTAEIFSERIEVQTVLGKITDECVNAGIQYGLVGAVDAVIAEMQRSVSNGGAFELVVCGGDGEWLFSKVKTPIQKVLDLNLIFKGLINMKNAGEI